MRSGSRAHGFFSLQAISHNKERHSHIIMCKRFIQITNNNVFKLNTHFLSLSVPLIRIWILMSILCQSMQATTHTSNPMDVFKREEESNNTNVMCCGFRTWHLRQPPRCCWITFIQTYTLLNYGNGKVHGDYTTSIYNKWCSVRHSIRICWHRNDISTRSGFAINDQPHTVDRHFGSGMPASKLKWLHRSDKSVTRDCQQSKSPALIQSLILPPISCQT